MKTNKRTYAKPSIQVFNLQSRQQLLSSSGYPNGSRGPYHPLNW